MSEVKNINFMVVIDNNQRCEVHIEKVCTKISYNLLTINKLSKITEFDVRRIHYGLVYAFISYKITVGDSTKRYKATVSTTEEGS
jgi:hypothetical protein